MAAEEQGGAAAAPGPPEGVQRPGVAGAGNLLDPQVRGELREQVRAAMPQPPGHAAAATPAAPPPPVQQQHRAGPFPHGDVDLSGFAANVPAGPIRARRGRVRSYYFLQQTEDTKTDEEPQSAPAIQPPPGPKPG